MSVVFIRAVILYLLLIFAVRFMGKHQIGELQPSELAVTILISNIATLPVENPDMPLFTGIIPILTLASLDVIMSWLGTKSRLLRRLTCGRPVVIISDGVIDRKLMDEIRFTADDLIAAMHSCGVFDLSEVQFAVVETTGKVSVYQKYGSRSVTNEDMGLRKKSIDPPEVIAQQGKIVYDGLKRSGQDERFIESVLKKENVPLKDVFIMTADVCGKYDLIREDG